MILTLRSSLRYGARGRVAPFRFAHPDITAIIWDFPAKNLQISLRETSDNRDVIFNRHVELLKGVSAFKCFAHLAFFCEKGIL